MRDFDIKLEKSPGSPLYLQLCDTLAEKISRGDLVPGERLPSERDLARSLGISRTTVVNAYDELRSRALVRGQVGRGTFVNASPDATGAPFAWRGKVSRNALRTVDPTLRWLAMTAPSPQVISFAAAVPALDLFPTEMFRESMDAVLQQGAVHALGLCPTEGLPKLRSVIAGRFRVRLEEVLVVSGAQQALDLISRCLLDAGDVVIMDRPGYVGAIQTFRSAGAHVIGWDIERADLEELEDLVIRYQPKALYTNPTFQNPTGATMPLGTRLALLDLAARYRLPVIEDEPYRDLSFDSGIPETLYHLDTNRLVIHIRTFSKTLSAGLRIGWLSAAEEIVDQLALFKQRCDVSSASLEQHILARMLERREFDQHMDRLTEEHAQRYRAMTTALDGMSENGALSYQPVSGGLYIWATLRPDLDSRELLGRAAAEGVLFVSGDVFDPDGYTKHQLRLCFSAEPVERIRKGINRLDSLLRAS